MKFQGKKADLSTNKSSFRGFVENYPQFPHKVMPFSTHNFSSIVYKLHTAFIKDVNGYYGILREFRTLRFAKGNPCILCTRAVCIFAYARPRRTNRTRINGIFQKQLRFAKKAIFPRW